MSKHLVLSLSLLLAFAAGCFETRGIVTLNPDGSGKVAIESVVTMDAPATRPNDEDALVAARKMAGNLMRTARGVEAWSDGALDVQGSRIHLKAVAYFKDIGKLSIFSLAPAKWAKDADGRMCLTADPVEPPAGEPQKMTPEQAAEAFQAASKSYTQNRANLDKVFGRALAQTTFILPGKIVDSNILAIDGQKATITFDGKKYMKSSDDINADEKLMKKVFTTGDRALIKERQRELMYGKKGQETATVAEPLKEQFDYKAEVAKAKEGQAAMCERLGIAPSKPPTAPSDAPAK